MSTYQVHLTEEKETLFITLYAKAIDNRSANSILNDKTADEILKTIDADFSKYNGFGNQVIVIRAKQFDDWIKEFIRINSDAVVVYLGCGLDTRITRINPPAGISWYDVDYPEVIALRKNFYSPREGYSMIESSITNPEWLVHIPANRPTMIIAEGVLEYLSEEEVKTLFQRLTGHFTNGQLLFDVMNSLAIQSGRKKLKETTGAIHKWIVDEVREVDKLNDRLKRVTELSLIKSSYAKKLPLRYRLLLGILSLFAPYRNMMRLLRYEF